MKNTQQVNKRKKNQNQIKVQTKENTLKMDNGGSLRGDPNASPVAQSKPCKEMAKKIRKNTQPRRPLLLQLHVAKWWSSIIFSV